MGCGSSKAAATDSPKPTSHTTSPSASPAHDTSSKLNNCNVIFVLGGPGSGKGTQCERIIARYVGVQHFSAGDLLREAVKSGNKELEDIMREGKLVPMEVTVDLLHKAMLKSDKKVFLIDGFPRALDQAEAFEKQIKPCDMVLAMECSEDDMRARLLERGKTSGRADDNEETIVKRFRTFVEQSQPVIEHFKEKGKCAVIPSVGTPDEVFKHVTDAIHEHMPHLPEHATATPVAKATQDEVAPVDATPAPVAAAEEDKTREATEAADAPGAAAADGKTLPPGSKIIFVLGGPGSGKGTQCDKIVAHYDGVKHLSAGDLLREAVKNGNSELEAIMREGKLVPMETTIGLLRDAMVASGASLFLIDGFPRALDQAHAFESGVQPCDAVLFFDCSEDAMRARLLERGKTSGRADDNEETIVKRFRTFVEQSKPVVEEFKEKGKVAEISAEQTPDEVFEEVKTALDAVLA